MCEHMKVHMGACVPGLSGKKPGHGQHNENGYVAVCFLDSLIVQHN